MMKTRLAVLFLGLGLLLSGCPESNDDDLTDTLNERLTELETRIQELESDLAAVEMAGYVTETWVGEQGYLTEETDPVATAAGYLTSFTETDPVATAAGYATEVWVGEQGYLTEETDPVATAAGYLTSFTETDPVATAAGYATEVWVEAQNYLTVEVDPAFDASVASTIVAADLVNWDEAFGWGDHSTDVTTNTDAIADLAASQVGRIMATDTDGQLLEVPGEFATVNDALAHLNGFAIDIDALVTIQVAAGTHTYAEAIVLGHPDGERIEIVGLGVATTILEFTDTDGVVVSGGNALGGLGELTLTAVSGDGTGIVVTDSSALLALGSVDVLNWTGGRGILVNGGATLAVADGADVLLDGNYYAGARVSDGSFADLTGATASNNTFYGFEVQGSYLKAGGATASDNGDNGFMVENGGVLAAGQSLSTNNGEHGYFLTRGSVGNVVGAESSYNYNGFYATEGSSLYAGNADSLDNTGTGYYAENGSDISADYSTSSLDGGNGYHSARNSTVTAGHTTVTTAGAVSYRSNYNGYVYATPDGAGDESTDNQSHVNLVDLVWDD